MWQMLQQLEPSSGSDAFTGFIPKDLLLSRYRKLSSNFPIGSFIIFQRRPPVWLDFGLVLGLYVCCQAYVFILCFVLNLNIQNTIVNIFENLLSGGEPFHIRILKFIRLLLFWLLIIFPFASH
jgi:hypothetical protein